MPKYIFLLLALIATLPATHAAIRVPPNDANIRTIGRWDKSDPALYHSYWDGAYLRTGFTGTGVKIKLAQGTRLSVSIDSEALRDIDAPPGVVDLTMQPLDKGQHTLLVGGAGQNEEVAFAGLELDDGARTYALPPRPIVEFVGDSITTGKGYGWFAGDALGADHVQIAFSGIALTSGFGCLDNKTGMDKQYFRLKNFNHLQDEPPVAWPFDYQPQIVVINLGQNDQCGSEPDEIMTASYATFLRAIRVRLPQTQIVALRPFGGAYAKAEGKAVENLIEAGDKRLQFVDTGGWLVTDDFRDGIHPNQLGHAKVALRLIPILQPLLSPTESQK